MVSLTILLGAAATAALSSTPTSALNLPVQKRLVPAAQQDPRLINNQTWAAHEYCRETETTYKGLARGPYNATIYVQPCADHSYTESCAHTERIATNVGANDTIRWIVDIPVNLTYYLAFESDGEAGGFYQAWTTVPPNDNKDCDQSKLQYPYSAISMDNTTVLIGEIQSGASSEFVIPGWAVFLAGAGVAALF